MNDRKTEQESMEFDTVRLAMLARLTLTEAEKEKLTADLQEIAAFADAVMMRVAGDTDPAQETFATAREDAVLPPLSCEEALRNAPAVQDGCITLPVNVIEGKGMSST